MLKSDVKSYPSATDPFFPGWMRPWDAGFVPGTNLKPTIY